MSEKMTNTYIYISSPATLNETLTAKYDGVFPQNTSKREIEHPRPFHMLDPPPPHRDYVQRLADRFVSFGDVNSSLLAGNTAQRLVEAC